MTYRDPDILAMWIFGAIVVLVVVLFTGMVVHDLAADRRRKRRRLAERARQRDAAGF